MSNIITKKDNTTLSALNEVDKKFKVGAVVTHLHKMMEGVVEKDLNPETVGAACLCVEQMNQVVSTAIKAARFLKENDDA